MQRDDIQWCSVGLRSLKPDSFDPQQVLLQAEVSMISSLAHFRLLCLSQATELLNVCLSSTRTLSIIAATAMREFMVVII